MRTIAIANQKGGSGKTASTVNLAAALGRSHPVLVIDFDPQAGATKWLGSDLIDGLAAVLTEGKPLAEVVAATQTEGVELVAASAWLRRAERNLQGEPGAETLFRQALAKLPKKRWAFVLVDCPPWVGLLTISALTACGEVVAPVDASEEAVDGYNDFSTTIQKVRTNLNRKLRTVAIVPNRVDERRGEDCRQVDVLRTTYGSVVTKQVIHESARIKEARAKRTPVEHWAPSSRAAEEFRTVAIEITRRS
jgi:chromosome partitioning protein